MTSRKWKLSHSWKPLVKDLKQLRGIIATSLTLQIRSFKSAVACVCIPVVCIVILQLLQGLFQDVVNELGLNEHLKHHIMIPFQPFTLVDAQEGAGLMFNMSFPVNEYFTYPAEISAGVNSLLNKIPLSHVPRRYKDGHLEYFWTPILTHFNTSNEMDEEIFSHISNSTFDILGGIHIHDYQINVSDYNSTALEYTVQYDYKDPKNEFNLDAFVDNVSPFCKAIEMAMNTRGCQAIIVVGLMDVLHGLVTQNVTGFSVGTKVQQIPYSESVYKIEFKIKEFYDPILFTVACSTLIPLFVYKLVKEKTERFKEYMKLMGMKPHNHVIANVLFMFTMYFLAIAVTWLFAKYVTNYRIVVQTNSWLLFLVFVCGGLSVISVSYLIAGVVRTTMVGTLFGFVYVMVIPVVSFVFLEQIIRSGVWWYQFLYVFQTLPLSKIFFELTNYCLNMHCLQNVADLYNDRELFIAIVYCLVDSVVYFVVGLYLEWVLPKKWGRKGDPLFFLKCFCFCNREKRCFCDDDKIIIPENEDQGVKDMRASILTKEFVPENQGILISGLVKAFGKKKAVDHLFLSVDQNEIVALLGGNGSGKTTTIRCLVGLYSQTKGRAFVSGNSISENIREVRKKLGYTPQFNVLWDELTPMETLLFYARLKNVAVADEYEHCLNLLKRIGVVGEDEKPPNLFHRILFWVIGWEKKVGELSEGVKRRLAIACALVGDPAVVILDEPTTGLDVSSQKMVWKIINEERKDKSILITTHSMHEAEVLADKIAIMSEGNLVSFGSTEQLKSMYGEGFIVRINTLNLARAKTYLMKEFAGYRLRMIKNFGGSSTFKVSTSPDLKSKKLRRSVVFTAMNSKVAREGFGIVASEISAATLEDVFLKVIKKAEAFEIEQERRRSRVNSQDLPSRKERHLLHRVRGVSDVDKSKRPKFNKERRKRRKFRENNNSERIGLLESPIEDENSNRKKKKKKKNVSFFLFIWVLQTWCLFKKNIILAWRKKGLTALILAFPILSIVIVFVLSFIQDTVNGEVLHPATINRHFQRCVPFESKQTCYSIVFSTQGNEYADEIMLMLFDKYSLVTMKDFMEFENCDQMTSWMKDFPNITQSGICWSEFDLERQKIEYILYFNKTTPRFEIGDIPSQIEVLKVDIDNLIYQWLTVGGNSTGGGDRPFKVQYKSFPKTRPEMAGKAQIWSSYGTQFFSVSTLMLLIVALHYLVIEKEKMLTRNLLVTGMRKFPYYLSWFLLLSCYAAVMTFISIAIGAAFLMNPFIFGNQLVLFFAFFLFSVSLISLGFFVSSFTTNRRMTIIYGFVFLGVFTVCGGFLSTAVPIFMDNKTSVWRYIFFQLLYPQWNFAYILTSIITITSANLHGSTHQFEVGPWFKFSDLFRTMDLDMGFGLIFETQPVFYSFLYLIANSVIYICLFVVVECVTTNWQTITSSILCIWMKLFPRKKKFATTPQSLSTTKRQVHPDRKYNVQNKHGDIVSLDDEDNKLLVGENVKKMYSSYLVKYTNVLEDVNIQIDKNACNVLIGNNGSGKSTLINVICGVHTATGGRIRILNRPIRNNTNFVRRNIGVCHQIDLLYDDLTAKQHMKLFCELKGMIDAAAINEEIESRLKQVSLWEVRDQIVWTFSGGMKKRLSVALACIGSPSLVIFDEPSCGLDPFSKRQVWELIFKLKEKENSGILLTSHSMQETEALHDKIFVLRDGVIYCEGNSIELKKEYGECYTVKIFHDGDLEKLSECTEFVSTLEKNADVKESELEIVVKVYPEDYWLLGPFFKKLENLETRFVVSPTSLENIYTRIVGGSEDDEDEFESGRGGRNQLRVSDNVPLVGLGFSERDYEQGDDVEVAIPLISPSSSPSPSQISQMNGEQND